MTPPAVNNGDRARPYQVFMLALSLVALIGLAAQNISGLPTSAREILEYTDSIICALFLIDFLVSLFSAKNKAQYFLTWGWIDLLSSIPAIDILRLGRLARILRIFRLLRGVKATKILSTFILERRAQGAFLAAVLVSILFVTIASIAELVFENVPGSNIRSAQDALWWAVTTITTVGYGDRYPVTSEGRVVAGLLMTAGVGLFGILSGFVASSFLAPAAGAQVSELDHVRAELASLRALLEKKLQAER